MFEPRHVRRHTLTTEELELRLQILERERRRRAGHAPPPVRRQHPYRFRHGRVLLLDDVRFIQYYTPEAQLCERRHVVRPAFPRDFRLRETASRVHVRHKYLVGRDDNIIILQYGRIGRALAAVLLVDF